MSFFIDKFRRVSSQAIIPQIDGLRFLAILSVILLHVRTAFVRNSGIYTETALNGVNNLNDILLTGGAGVNIFFVISGFICSLPFAKYYFGTGKKISLKKYFYKRLTRITPPYIITLLFFLGVHIILNTKDIFELLQHFFASVFFLHYIIYHTWSLINPVAWALEIEIQFYIILPLLTLIFMIKNKLLRRVFLILLIVFFISLVDIFHFRNLTIISYAHYFLLGFLIADFYLTNDDDSSVIMDIFGILGVICIFLGRFYHSEVLILVSIFTVVYAAFKGNYFKKIISYKILTIIGGISYVTYLIHYPIAIFICKLTKRFIPGFGFEIDFLIFATFIVPIIFIISGALFLFIEKPFMEANWPQKMKNWLISVNSRP